MNRTASGAVTDALLHFFRDANKLLYIFEVSVLNASQYHCQLHFLIVAKINLLALYIQKCSLPNKYE